MIYFLAAAAPDAGTKLPDPAGYQATGWLILGLGALVILVGGIFFALNQIREWREGRNTLPQPLLTKEAKRYVTKEEFDQHKKEISQRVTVVEAQQSVVAKAIADCKLELMIAGAERGDTINERLNDISSNFNNQLQAIAREVGEALGQLKRIKL